MGSGASALALVPEPLHSASSLASDAVARTVIYFVMGFFFRLRSLRKIQGGTLILLALISANSRGSVFLLQLGTYETIIGPSAPTRARTLVRPARSAVGGVASGAVGYVDIDVSRRSRRPRLRCSHLRCHRWHERWFLRRNQQSRRLRRWLRRQGARG
jgi:hypothetical protein